MFGAASVTSSFGVSATVESGCLAIASPGSLASSDGVRVSATLAVAIAFVMSCRLVINWFLLLLAFRIFPI
jgi:hypothetical protein